jgi:agmatinase
MVCICGRLVKLTLLQPLDIAILGFPYDTSTSYRPGARFGPRGIRAGSAREKKGRSYNTVWEVDPYEQGLEVVSSYVEFAETSRILTKG